MWCTTECWSCEDRKCEHYISKTELYFENQRKDREIERLNNIINELERLLEHDKKFHKELIDKIGISNLEEQKNCSYTLACYDCCDLYLNKLQDLKGEIDVKDKN